MGHRAFFTCISLQKRLVLENKEEVQREEQRSLERLVEQETCETALVLSGGCIFASGVSIAEGAGFAAVFRG